MSNSVQMAGSSQRPRRLTRRSFFGRWAANRCSLQGSISMQSRPHWTTAKAATRWRSAAETVPYGWRTLPRARSRLSHQLRTGHSRAGSSPYSAPTALDWSRPARAAWRSLWDTRAATVLQEFKGHTGDVKGARYSPDGQRVATSSADGTVRIWQVEANKPPVVITTKKNIAFELLNFNPDGTHLATASISSDRAMIWDSATGAEIAALEGHKGNITRLASSPDGKYLATSSYDKTVRIWDADTGKPGPVLSHDAVMRQLSFNSKGTRLATAGDGMTSRIWDVKTGDEVKLFLKTAGVVRSVRFSPDGTRIVAAGDGKVAWIWDAEKGELLRELRGHQQPIYHVAFSPDGKQIVTGGNDISARIWDVATGDQLAALPIGSPVLSVGYSGDGRSILTTASNMTASLWDAKTGKLVAMTGNPRNASITSLAFSNDSRAILTLHAGGKVGIWDPQTARIRTVLNSGGRAANTAVFSRDGSRVATACGFANPSSIGALPFAQIWVEAGERPELVLRGPSGAVVSEACFSPDGKLAITVSKDWTAKVWDATTGKHLVQPGPAKLLAFIRLVSGRGDQSQWQVRGHNRHGRKCEGLGRGHREDLDRAQGNPVPWLCRWPSAQTTRRLWPCMETGPSDYSSAMPSVHSGS